MLPVTYTVKLTKGDQTYIEQLNVAMDPRAKYPVEERKAQFDLSMKVYKELEHMTYGVEAIEGVRDGANARAAKVSEKDLLHKQLQQLAADCDKLRSKIVATKEGGMITGEERLREFLGGLYSDVNGYEGRPTDSQAARADVLARELEDVIRELSELANRQLPTLNQALEAKRLGAIRVMPEAEWLRTRGG